MALLTPEYLKNKSYDAIKDRYVWQTGPPIQEGVWGGTDFLASQRAAGSDRSVDVAAGAAWVLGDDTTRQGLYHIINDAPVNVPLNAADATNPRIDQIVLVANDSQDGGRASDTPTLTVLTGTATSGATLDNRNGAAALPASALRIADVLVGANVSAITNANIRDRRPWCRGAYAYVSKTDADISMTTNAAWQTITAITDAQNFHIRVESSGKPMRAYLVGSATHSTVTAVMTRIEVDGTAPDTTNLHTIGSAVDATQNYLSMNPYIAYWEWTPAAGSHIIRPAVLAPAGQTFGVYSNASRPARFVVEEIVMDNKANNPAGYG